MLDKLGAAGLLGVLLMVGGVAVVALESLLVAGGIALVVAGLGLLVFGLVKNLLASLGIGGIV
jgi:hypothetical protein